METILAFMAMNVLLAVVMAAFTFKMQRSVTTRGGIAAVAMVPVLCWGLWANTHASPPRQAFAAAAMTIMSPMPEVQLTGAIAPR